MDFITELIRDDSYMDDYAGEGIIEKAKNLSSAIWERIVEFIKVAINKFIAFLQKFKKKKDQADKTKSGKPSPAQVHRTSRNSPDNRKAIAAKHEDAKDEPEDPKPSTPMLALPEKTDTLRREESYRPSEKRIMDNKRIDRICQNGQSLLNNCNGAFNEILKLIQLVKNQKETDADMKSKSNEIYAQRQEFNKYVDNIRRSTKNIMFSFEFYRDSNFIFDSAGSQMIVQQYTGYISTLKKLYSAVLVAQKEHQKFNNPEAYRSKDPNTISSLTDVRLLNLSIANFTSRVLTPAITTVTKMANFFESKI